MNARKVAAEFAAYVWYEGSVAGNHSKREATQFAKENWTNFLPVANPGLGRFLLKIARKRGEPHSQRRRPHREVAAVG